MKKLLASFISGMLILGMVSGCGKKNDSGESQAETENTFEVQHKTENEVVHVTDGIMPQVIEKKVTYVQKEKDGQWEVESSEIVNWNPPEDFIILNTVWFMETDDAASMFTYLDDSYSGKKATFCLNFSDDLFSTDFKVEKDPDGTPVLRVVLSMHGNIIVECEGEKIYLKDIKIKDCVVCEDGSSHSIVDCGNGEETLFVPSDVRQGTKDEYLAFVPSLEDRIRAESDTYIDMVSFDNLPRFEVASPNVTDGKWDVKITNTKYGENISPELSWEEVEGATNYVIIMLDGSWLHMDVYTTETHLSEGAFGKGERGAQYVGPYPPSGTHTYSIFVFALKGEMSKEDFFFDAGNNSTDKIFKGLDEDKDGNTGNVIAYGRLDGNYTHQD